MNRTKHKRPTKRSAQKAIRTLLKTWVGEGNYIPSFTLEPNGYPETDAPSKIGWAFWILDDDTTSYVHNDLSIEWYGSSWAPEMDHE